jgi:hypothetical protein
LDREEVANRLVYNCWRNFTTCNGTRKICLQETATIQIHTSIEDDGTRVVGIISIVMVILNAINSPTIASNIAVKSPLLTREVREEIGIRTRGNTVDGIVGTHDASRGCSFGADAGLEWWVECISQILVSNNGVETTTILSICVLEAVASEMFTACRNLQVVGIRA